MQLYVRLHNSEAGTGLLRCVNLLSSHALCRGQTSRCWPWSPGSISHGTRNQKWCRTEHARQSTYQSPCAQGWRDPRWRTPLIILNNTVTQWALVGDPTDWICCMTTQKCQFAALLCRQRDNAFWQNVSHEYEDFSCCHRNNDQDCKKQSKALLALPARLFFMKSIVSRPLEDYFSLFSFTALFLFLKDWDCCCTKPFKTFPSCFPFGCCFCWLFLASYLFHLRRTGTHPAGHICRPAPWVCSDGSGQLGRCCMYDNFSDCPRPVFVCV